MQEKIINLINQYRKLIGYLLITSTVLLFGYYIRANPEALAPLKSTPLIIIPVLLAIYLLFLMTNLAITHITIQMCKKDLPFFETMQLTLYSTLVNFFGPLQSGPGFRAIYLKRKIGLSIKNYTGATSLYYISFAGVSLAMLFGAKYPLVVAGSIIVTAIILIRLKPNIATNSNVLIATTKILIVTTVQLMLVALIYYIELRSVGFKPDLASTFAYTGSANLALFVAFTPAAIGVRESFIYIAQSIHEIPTDVVLSASLLDRSIYLVLLLLLFSLSSSLHIKRRLNVRHN